MAAIPGGVAAACCLVTRRDRSPLVLVAAVPGAIVLLWTIAEIAVPH